jgi:Tfp pilus assembly protein PilN
MIGLNILPPEEKKEILSQKTLRQVLTWGSSGLIIVLAFLALLASIWLYSYIQLNSIQEIVSELEASPQNQNFKDIKKEIDGMNQQLQSFSKLQSQEKDYSFYLEKLTDLANPGIKLNSVSFDASKVNVSGQATTRDVLLTFKSALEGSSYFQNVNTPLSNFLKQTNIGFTFSFELKPQM